MGFTSAIPQNYFEGLSVGGVAGAAAAREQLDALLLPGETVAFAVGGDDGAALFTDRRLIISTEAGLLNRRRMVRVIARSAIGAFSIDVENVVNLTLLGKDFGTAQLLMDKGFDPIKLSQWLSQPMTASPI